MWLSELTTAADTALLDGLGEERLAALQDRGAALEAAEAVAFLRTEADRVLGAESTS